MKKLAIVTTHPIQYNAPWFQLLAERGKVELKVFYTWSQSKKSVKDKVFGKEIQWDIPLLEGYEYEFVENVSKKPGSYHFFGIDNPNLIKSIKNYQPDAILFFGWNFKSHLKAMRYFHGKIPVWFRGDSTLLDETAGLKTQLRRLILTKIYQYVDKAFYVGEANKAYFLKHGLKEKQLVYAPHAIDNDRFGDGTINNYTAEALQWRRDLGYKLDDIVVVFAGKLEAKKQPDFLINAFKKAAEVKDTLQLLIVGNGPMEKVLIDEEHSNIKFIPFQNQTKMPLVYRLGDVVCLPSKGPGETWGLAVNEAMACNRPVIVSDKVGCSQDLVSHNITGFVFEHNNLKELTTILLNVDKLLLNKMGTTAREKIKKYSFFSIAEAIEKNMIHLSE